MSVGQPFDGVENDVAFGARHAGGGLVEQQHFGLQPDRDRQLDQALAAIGQFGHAVAREVRKLQRLQKLHRFLDDVGAPAGRIEHRSTPRRRARRPPCRHFPEPTARGTAG